MTVTEGILLLLTVDESLLEKLLSQLRLDERRAMVVVRFGLRLGLGLAPRSLCGDEEDAENNNHEVRSYFEENLKTSSAGY